MLVLRRQWRETGHEVRFRDVGQARYAVIAEAARKSRPWGKAGPTAGAFHIIGRGQPLDLARHEFVVTTGKLASKAGMPAGAARLLNAALIELMENVTEHAGDDVRGLAAFELGEKTMSLTVADSGRGVVQGYVASQPELHGLAAMQALEWAVREHRSRLTERGRGTGFSTVMRAMRTLDAALRVRSDDASIEIEGAGGDAQWVARDQPLLRGFVVSLHLSWR